MDSNHFQNQFFIMTYIFIVFLIILIIIYEQFIYIKEIAFKVIRVIY